MHHSLSTGSTTPHQRSTSSSSTVMTAAPCPRRNNSNSGHHHGSAASNHLATKHRLLPEPSSTATTTSTSNSGNNSKSALSALFWFVLGVCCTCTVFQQWSVLAQCDLFGSSPTTTLTSSINMASHDATELLDLAMIAANTNGHIQKSSGRSSSSSSDSRRATPRQQPGALPVVLTRERRELYRYAAPKARPVASALAKVSSSECGSAPNYTAYFAQPPRLRRSLHNEDQTVFRHFFQGQDSSGGFRYIELGAFNGVTESHSRFYDECLGWEG
jgi:hypothetical protein